MAIKVNGTTVIDDSRQLQNVASVDATTAASITAAGVGGSLSSTTLTGNSPTASLNDTTHFEHSFSSDASATFSNIPTKAEWTYFWNGGTDVNSFSFEALAAEGYTQPDLSIITPGVAANLRSILSHGGAASRTALNAAFGSNTFLIRGATMKEDGTIILIYGMQGSTHSIRRFNLSTPFDLTTMVYDASKSLTQSNMFYLSANSYMVMLHGGGYATGYQTAYTSSGISTYQVGGIRFTTPWNPSTGVKETYRIPSGNAYTVSWNNDGTAFYWQDGSSNTNKVTLSTPWKVNSATSATNLGHQGLGYSTIFKFSDDGSRIFIAEYNYRSMRLLSTPFDLTTQGNDVYNYQTLDSASTGYNMTDFGTLLVQNASGLMNVNMTGSGSLTFPQISSYKHKGAADTWNSATLTTFDGGQNIYADVQLNIFKG